MFEFKLAMLCDTGGLICRPGSKTGTELSPAFSPLSSLISSICSSQELLSSHYFCHLCLISRVGEEGDRNSILLILTSFVT